MKIPRVSLCALIPMAAVFQLALSPSLHADDEDSATVALLVSAPWKLSTNTKSDIRVFLKDGTFTTPGKADESGQWTMSKDFVILIFPNGHKDALTLPLNAKGTGGYADNGDAITATLFNPAATNSAPSPPPAAASAPQAAAAVAQGDAATAALLTSGPWKIFGPKWSRIRYFNKDGTFTNQGAPKGHGQWKIENSSIIVTFADGDGHPDTLSLPLDPKGTHGVSSAGVPFTCVLVSATAGDTTSAPDSTSGPGDQYFGSASLGSNGPPAQTPSSPPAGMRQQTADLLKTCQNSLLFLNSKDAAGNGFIAAISGSNYLVTNAAVAASDNNAAFKTLDNTPEQGGAASLAVGRDIVCMALPTSRKPLEIMQDVGANAAIGDDVVVPGCSAGGVNAIEGKITGIGPDRVDVDAPFGPGDSGSPIIHAKTGKVIAVAAYDIIKKYDPDANENNSSPTIRHYGYRLDNVKTWQAVDWRPFYAQAAGMRKIETFTSDLDDLFRDLQANKAAIKADQHPDPVFQARIGLWLEDRSAKHSAGDIKAIDANFLSFLKSTCQQDMTAARQSMTYDYFQRRLAGEQKTRGAISAGFEGIITNIGSQP